MTTKAKRKSMGLAWDIINDVAGPLMGSREDFISTIVDHDCQEYRFQGRIGFGGKFWPERMAVTMYPEHETPERLKIMRETNERLKALDLG